MSSIIITLTGVAAIGRHGVFAFERDQGQRFVVDATVTVTRPSERDELDTTLDYGELAAEIIARIEGEPFALIETLAVTIADAVVTRPGVEKVEITVHKPEAPIEVPFHDVSVTVSRSVR